MVLDTNPNIRNPNLGNGPAFHQCQDGFRGSGDIAAVAVNAVFLHILQHFGVVALAGTVFFGDAGALFHLVGGKLQQGLEMGFDIVGRYFRGFHIQIRVVAVRFGSDTSP